MGSFNEAIAQFPTLGLDTCIFIYHLEQHPRYQPLTQVLLQTIESGECQAIASVLSVMELAVRPWQLDRPDIALDYARILEEFPNLGVADVTTQIAQEAARLRAQYQLRSPDALQVATAIVHRTSAFVTNDRGLLRIKPEIPVIVLDEYCAQQATP